MGEIDVFVHLMNRGGVLRTSLGRKRELRRRRGRSWRARA